MLLCWRLRLRPWIGDGSNTASIYWRVDRFFGHLRYVWTTLPHVRFYNGDFPERGGHFDLAVLLATVAMVATGAGAGFAASKCAARGDAQSQASEDRFHHIDER
jgi:hypothetical protein